MSTTDKRRWPRLAAAFLLTLGSIAASLTIAEPASAVTICEQFGSTTSGDYRIMNNRWGTSATQCINTTTSGFSIIQQDGIGNFSGAPTAYPAIYLGCHFGSCSPSTALPRQINTIGSAPGSISLSYPTTGSWDAAYDIWLNVDNNTSGNQDTEIMIWLNRFTAAGNIQPIGSPVGTVTLAGRSWQVWVGNNGSNNVVSYLFQGSALTSFSFDVMNFISDTFSRGSQFGNTSWWLTSVQAGFEPWAGGVGLTVNSFSQTVSGTGGGTVPGTPGTPVASGVTASSVNLTWGASSGTVSNYQIERCTGATCTNFAQVGTSTTTSFGDSGLAASTTYRYRVRATNSAGNSGYSNTVNATTSGGGSGGGCSATLVTQTSWNNGYVMQPNGVTNSGTSTINGWTVTFTLPAGHTITGFWNATVSISGQTVTARGIAGQNATLGAGGSTTWGFQASRPNGNTQLPSGPTCATP
jgi:hypothetical protein